jgi:hypothetical protein
MKANEKLIASCDCLCLTGGGHNHFVCDALGPVVDGILGATGVFASLVACTEIQCILFLYSVRYRT